MAWNDGLETPHLEIAGSHHRQIGVLAGPGTGKTTYGLLRRVVRLLEDGVPGRRILLLSFTRVAAADLREKSAALQAPGVDEIKASTLHGYCFGLLQRDAVLTVTGRHPRILLDHERDLMLRDLGQEFGSIYDRQRALEAFQAGWARGTEEYVGLANTPADRVFEHGVLSWLRDHRAMLIGEVVPVAYRYLVTNPVAAELDAFEHVIVDEYQDLNALEQGLLDTLAANGSLCVAGDDDQSIYSVRYANPDGILRYFERENVERHTIQVCDRCPPNILSMANSLIRQAPRRQKADLVPKEARENGPVALVQWPDVDTEVDGIASAIAGDVGSERREPGQILVLTNWRLIGERIRSRLNELAIPTRSYFTEEELSADEAREGLALLRLVVDMRDAPALRVLVGLGESTGRSAAYQRLLAYARTHETPPREVLDHLAKAERLDLAVPALVARYVRSTARVEYLRGLGLSDLIDDIFPEAQATTADLREVALAAIPEAEHSGDVLKAVIDAVTQDEVPQHPNFVRVMSLHKSKGLTSESVYVVGAVNGVLPTIRSVDGGGQASVEEGRRLFYVAITRASEELVISGALWSDLATALARGLRFDKSTIRTSRDGRHVVRTIASPYIAELGASAPPPIRGAVWLAQR